MFASIDRDAPESIQAQLRRSIVGAIHAGKMAPGQKLPPSRRLAEQLGIARNTVAAVYEELVARGYLEAVPRRGYFVGRELDAARDAELPASAPGALDWAARIRQRPSALRHVDKPSNWQDYEYPFVCGQVDPRLFPIDTWRACSRDALGRSAIDWWTADRAVEDDPLLVEQIRTQVLPQRGIFARPEQILVTLGTQEGLYLLSRLLARPGVRVGVESPGYPDARNIFAADGAEIVDLPLPRLVGRHQYANAGAAIRAVKAAGFPVDNDAIEKGLTSVKWAGRMQRLTEGHLLDALPKGSELWLDGGHNPGAGQVIAEAFATLEERNPRPLYLVVGMLSTKDPIGYFSAFKGLAKSVFTVAIANSDAGLDPLVLADDAIDAGLTAEPVSDIVDALDRIGGLAGGEIAPRVLIGGSLYLVGEALELNGTLPD